MERFQGQTRFEAATFSSDVDISGTLTASNVKVQTAKVTLTNAEIKALAASPKELVAAPGANHVLEFVSAILRMVYGGTNVFTESGDNLAVKYTDDSGVAVSTTIETTGWIDQNTSAQTRAIPVLDAIVADESDCVNAPLVLDNLGSEIAGNAGNDNTMEVYISYIDHDLS